MRASVEAFEREFGRYQGLGGETLGQVDEAQVHVRLTSTSNSIAMLVWHVAGNLESRFTDFLTTDGEKPWRDREGEFAVRSETLEEVVARWDLGWKVLGHALAELQDRDLERPVTIRGVDFTVLGALNRALAHIAYHVGQMAFLSKALLGDEWRYLTIPPGGTEAYNRNPFRERG